MVATQISVAFHGANFYSLLVPRARNHLGIPHGPGSSVNESPFQPKLRFSPSSISFKCCLSLFFNLSLYLSFFFFIVFYLLAASTAHRRSPLLPLAQLPQFVPPTLKPSDPLPIPPRLSYLPQTFPLTYLEIVILFAFFWQPRSVLLQELAKGVLGWQANAELQQAKLRWGPLRKAFFSGRYGTVKRRF